MLIARRHLPGLLAAPAFAMLSRAGPGRAAGLDPRPCRPAAAPFASAAPGFLALLAENRAAGRPNLITEALLVQMLALSLRRAQRRFEAETLAPLFGQWLAAVAAALPAGAARQPAGQLLAVTMALLDGSVPDARRARAEVERARAAAGIARSAVLGIDLDFSQMKPRGHMADDPALARLFQAMRYAGLAPLLLNATPATGVSERQALANAETALILSRAMQAGAAGPLTARLDGLLAAAYGPADDFSAADVPADSTDAAALRTALLATGRRPQVIDVVMDAGRLGALAPAQAATGWRLLPGRRLADVAAMQQLVAPHVGAALGAGATSFAAGLIDGQVQRAYVGLDDVRLLYGLGAAADAPDFAFAGMAAAANAAWARLLEPALPSDHLRRFLISAGAAPAPDRITTLLGAYVHYRHGLAAVAKQSMAPVPKSMALPRPREGAVLASDPLFIAALAELARGHAARFADPAWDEWQRLLARLGGIALRRSHVCADAADERLLNNLDFALAPLIDAADDAPLAVDIHSVPSEGRATQIGIGRPRAIRIGAAVGADFALYQWKQPMANRLTDREFAAFLASDAEAAARYTVQPA